MTHVLEGGVMDRVCVLRSLLQEKTFRQSAVHKHLYVRMYRFVCGARHRGVVLSMTVVFTNYCDIVVRTFMMFGCVAERPCY